MPGVDRTVDREGLEVLDLASCLELLASQQVGRVAFVDHGEPVVLPVNHLVDGRGIAFRTAPGSMLDTAVMGRAIAFEVDEHDDATRTGWSVLVRGTADHVTDEDDVRRLDAAGLEPWADHVERADWVRIRPSSVTGRRIARRGDDAPAGDEGPGRT